MKDIETRSTFVLLVILPSKGDLQLQFVKKNMPLNCFNKILGIYYRLLQLL